MSATLVQLDIEGTPTIRIEGSDDARDLVAILFRNGIRVNLRGASPSGEEQR